MSQEQRDRVMKKLRGEAADLLIATDVAARGLDIPQLTHVINFDVPSAPEAYVHRIGRVGRAGREGVAITLAEPREHRLMRNIEQLTKRKIEIAPVPTRRRPARAPPRADARVAARGDRRRASSSASAVVVESLADEFDPMQVAMAAVKLLLGERGARARGGLPGRSPPGGERRFEPRATDRRAPGRGDGRTPRAEAPGADRPRPGMTRLFIGGGREMGIRPQDIVGAITGEAGISGARGRRDHHRRPLLAGRGPRRARDEVVGALRGRPVKGRKVTVRLERGAAGGAPRPRERAWGRPTKRDDQRPAAQARRPRPTLPLKRGGALLAGAKMIASRAMDIGVPKEIKAEENRVALTPAGTAALVAHGHRVFVERGAGAGSGLPDARYAAAGAQICADADETWAKSQLILKVKEPVGPELAPSARGPDAVHLPAPRGERGADARAARRAASPRSPTRRCSSTTARCRCSRR